MIHAKYPGKMFENDLLKIEKASAFIRTIRQIQLATPK